MSHNPERKEKNCLNCDTHVHGRFCHVCGQENIITKEKFWSLAKHFVYDILHFDGLFFHTLKVLFTKPGFVSRQYAEGKRASYLHPIRMYLFTSAIFFLIFFSAKKIEFNDDHFKGNLDVEERGKMAKAFQKRLQKNPIDSFLKARIALLNDTTKTVNVDSLGWQKEVGQIQVFSESSTTSLEKYDSLQKALPDSAKDKWVTRQFARQAIKMNKKFSNNQEGLQTTLDSFVHKFPYILFLSLPFFALNLKLLYIRRKNFYYSDHAIFTLYHYILSFILLLILFGLIALKNWTGWGVFTFLIVGICFSWPVYLYLQMKRFYRQSRLKTISKFLLLNLLAYFVIVILFLLFLLLSFFQF